jgi:hypothetical protein
MNKIKNRNIFIKRMICKPRKSGLHLDRRKEKNKKMCRKKIRV